MPQDVKETIFQTAVRVHLETAKPIGSKILARQHLKQFSPSTIRSYLSELVDDELLESIHFSVGRIPTDSGWRLFFEGQLERQSPQRTNRINSLHGFVRTMAAELNNVFVVREGERQFVEGLKETLAQPEFDFRDLTADFLELIEKIINAEQEKNFLKTVQTFIGAENPFGDTSDFSVMIVRTPICSVVVAGPKRMNYFDAYQVLERIKNSFT